MKSLFLLIALFFQVRVFAGYDNTAPKAWANDLSAQSLARQQNAFAQQESDRKYQAALLAAQQAELAKIYSKDPWRKIGSNTNLARGDGWVEFQGTIQEPLDNGVVFKGKYGQILTIHADPSYSDHLVQKMNSSQVRQKSGSTTQTTFQQEQETSFERRKVYGDDLFYVEDFPYPAEKGLGYEQMMALDGDYYSYTNSRNQLITIHKLIYGRPCQKSWTAEEIASAKQKQDLKKQGAMNKIIKTHQDLADKGDAYGLLRMAEHFRDGDGVEKDLAKARQYFSKAIEAGSPTAEAELKQLPAN